MVRIISIGGNTHCQLNVQMSIEFPVIFFLNPILPRGGGGGCSAPPLRFFAHNSEKEKNNSTKFGDFS